MASGGGRHSRQSRSTTNATYARVGFCFFCFVRDATGGGRQARYVASTSSLCPASSLFAWIALSLKKTSSSAFARREVSRLLARYRPHVCSSAHAACTAEAFPANVSVHFLRNANAHSGSSARNFTSSPRNRTEPICARSSFRSTTNDGVFRVVSKRKKWSVVASRNVSIVFSTISSSNVFDALLSVAKTRARSAVGVAAVSDSRRLSLLILSTNVCVISRLATGPAAK